MKKMPKVKITETDIESFDPKDFQIDPFWLDLYFPDGNYKKA